MDRIWGTLDVESGGVLVEEAVGESCCLEKYGSNAIKFVLFPSLSHLWDIDFAKLCIC